MAFGSLSLKARALKALASREHSRVELTRKLAPHADSPEALEALLDTLEAQGLLSQQRFVESLLRRRGARLGNARIRQELKQHRLDETLVSSAMAELTSTELERAREVWRRRFGVPAEDALQRARQGRFLLQRGFSGEVVARVLRLATEEPEG